MTSSPALAGVRILDLTRLLPGPLATLMLADLGADVLKLEPPGSGDPIRALPPRVGALGAAFQALNRGKRSLVLDLKHPRGPETLLRLARTADVVVEGFRPGVLERLGVGYQALCEAREDIILCSITGFGQTGPDRLRPGHDNGFAARAGILDATGAPGGPPLLPGAQVADLVGGAWQALAAILGALYQRSRTGQGQWLDVSMLDGAASCMLMGLAEAAAGARPRPRGQGALTGGLAAYAVYRTRDDRFVAVGALEPEFFAALCQGLELPDLAGQGTSAGPEVQARLSARIAELTRAELFERLAGLPTCVEPVQDPAEVLTDRQLCARGMFVALAGPEGAWPVLASPLRLAGGQAPVRAAPGLGEHTREILTEAGFPAEELAALVESGAVAAAR
jgi:crotonobetainyl-CoA:carnitine CoA-transferase CaiB-like acyl-CoA transferase